MTSAAVVRKPTGILWAFPVLSLLLGGLFLLPAPRISYLIGVTVVALVAATWIAAGDHRTGLLPNRYTAPLAVSGVLQVLVACTGTHLWATIALPCVLGATLTTAGYLVLGLLGWVGFGDVKFAAGLALLVAIPAGWTGLALLPLAVAFSSLSHLAQHIVGKTHRSRRPHGPALAAALAVLMVAACASQS